MALRVPSKQEVGQRLRWLRKQAGLSGRGLSRELVGKVDPSLSPDIEKGERLTPQRLMELANIFAGRGDLIDDPEMIVGFINGFRSAEDVMSPRPLSLVPPVDGASVDSTDPESETGGYLAA